MEQLTFDYDNYILRYWLCVLANNKRINVSSNIILKDFDIHTESIYVTLDIENKLKENKSIQTLNSVNKRVAHLKDLTSHSVCIL